MLTCSKSGNSILANIILHVLRGLYCPALSSTCISGSPTAVSLPVAAAGVRHALSALMIHKCIRRPASFPHVLSILQLHVLLFVLYFEPLRQKPLQAKHCCLVPLCHAPLPMQRGHECELETQKSSLFSFCYLDPEHPSVEF